MNKDLISVIVTCYNRQQFVGAALTSIKNQTYTNFECIIVDDGSTDHSREIIEKTIEGDFRFKFYPIDHIGFPLAKNYALDRVQGDYIIFLDSDDIAHPQWLNLLHYTCTITNAPIAVCRFLPFKADDKITFWLLTKKTPLHMAEYSFLRMDLSYNARIMHFMWNKLIRADLYKGIRHRDQIALSDVDVMGDIIFNAKYVVELKLPLVYYRQHDQSMNNITKAKGAEYWVWRLNFQKEKVRIDWNRAPQGRFAYQEALKREVELARKGIGEDFDKLCTLDDIQDMLTAEVPHITEQQKGLLCNFHLYL